jgi:preprotein translocase, SecY subunit
MLKTIKSAFKVREIRKRIFYVFIMLIIIRIGSIIPIPGVEREFFRSILEGNDLLNMFSGGALEQSAIFALSINPYITSSIIMQLLTIAIPKLEELQKDGEEGRKKIASITRYVTIGLALFESTAMAIGFGNRGWITGLKDNPLKGVIVVASLTAGSAFLMWVGERINEKGIGNGISVVLAINIIARIPNDLGTLYENFIKTAPSIARGALAGIIILAIIVLVVMLVLVLNGASRKIPVQYSKKMQGRKMVGGQSSHIPLKVNTAGVIPIIFASSIMSFPGIIAQFMGKDQGTGIGSQIMMAMNSNSWFNRGQPIYTLGLLFYIFLVVFFAYFYTSITFNPLEVADNMKKQGGFVPGIRPGKPTVEFLTRILNYVIFIGAIGLVIVAVIPFFFNGMFNANVSFGGTSLIIVSGVVLETIQQMESMMLVRNYKGFLND